MHVEDDIDVTVPGEWPLGFFKLRMDEMEYIWVAKQFADACNSESKFIWMRFLNSNQREFFGAKSIIVAKPVIT